VIDMTTWIASLILPAWLHYTLSNLPAVIVSVLVGYFIGKEGGFFDALKRFFLLLVIGAMAVALTAIVQENWPQLTGQPVEEPKSHFKFWED